MITNTNVNGDQSAKQKRCAAENLTDLATICVEDKQNMLSEVVNNKCDASTQTSQKRAKPTPRVEALSNKVNILEKRLKCRDTKMGVMEAIIKTLKDNSTYSEGIQDILEKRFSGDTLELLPNEINDVTSNNRQYSDDIRQFALTYYFYSPKAYALLRNYLSLPHPETMRKWMSTYDCEPGLLTKVLKYLETFLKHHIWKNDC
ncbi:uncharacterized protein [Neodiprion pinetum]|uniref:uncharacterized protein n=1 Tax=Neodiprion pinetum TaxID=441929 RepID=UPI0037128284